jgi:hypothetical protein
MSGTLDSLFGGNKPIQRGKAIILAGAGVLSVDVTISAVVINKTAVIINSLSSASSAAAISAAPELINTTTLRLHRGAGSSSNTDVYWQVLESK